MNENDIVITNTEFETSVEQVGSKGDNYSSAYRIWLNLGNLGTEQDFINSLKGKKGDNYSSVYRIWLNLGNLGTEKDFINSLKSPNIDNGAGLINLQF